MKLYVVRHATASRKSTWHKDDGLRPLTRDGRRRFKHAAEALVSAGAIDPKLIVTSPLTRATQTATILRRCLPGAVPVVVDARLGHGFTPADLAAVLAEHRKIHSVAIVGHNPSLCEVLSAVTGEADLDLRKGAVALVDIREADGPRGRLMWLAPPSLFEPPTSS